ncbi:unnamed protein product [Sphagnum jensenii]|uniref:GDT1 family protein n=1 Tax=Sphagnum jensenii TaxID=128206 RepID=A0ABP0WX54_9BRYO
MGRCCWSSSLLLEITSSSCGLLHHNSSLTTSRRSKRRFSQQHTVAAAPRGLVSITESSNSGRISSSPWLRFSQCSTSLPGRLHCCLPTRKRRIVVSAFQAEEDLGFQTDEEELLLQSKKELKLLQSSSSFYPSPERQEAMLEEIVALHNSSTQAEIFFPGDDRERNFVKALSSLSQLLRDHPKWQALVQFAVVGAIAMGMQACAPALAEVVGLEVASEQSSAGIFSNLGDIQSGFASAFLLIFFSEIGDKTFFIAALLATRKSNLAVFTGTFGALAAMTVISVTLGRAFHYLDGVLPFSLGNMELPLDDLAAVVLLVYFGVSTLLEASSMDGSKAEEEQQEAELAIAGVGADGAQGLQATAGTVAAAFALVFVAEWGDKSFFSTIALAAASSPLGVVTGAIAGHGVATVLAVLGGSFLGTYISEKVIAYVGGTLFLVFAAATLVEIIR